MLNFGHGRTFPGAVKTDTRLQQDTQGAATGSSVSTQPFISHFLAPDPFTLLSEIIPYKTLPL